MVSEQRLPPPDDLRQEIERSIAIGVALYRNDRASALATDVMLANVPAPRKLGIAGYLTFQDGSEDGRPLDTWRTTFFSADDPPNELCVVRVPTQPDTTPTFTSSALRTPLSSGMQLMARVRQTALAAIAPHAQPQNPVILPSPDKPGFLVYLLAGTPRNNVAVLGQHHRVLVSLDGQSILNLEPLTKSIIEIPLETPDGQESAGFFVTHLVTAWPLETHVFASLLHRTPVAVGTSRGTWVVEGTRISLLPSSPSDTPPPVNKPTPSASPSITPMPRFNAILSRKPWWRFW